VYRLKKALYCLKQAPRCNVLAGNYLLNKKQNKYNKITSFILKNFPKTWENLNLKTSLH